ncbi:uncharacterized protein ATNIH1004_006597 [Aspergillus tanneri]|uniref:Uncharacterized protein n=1 Tax=Aspergillus tanneri TaxID=1220188 RepID=A0A5M9MLL3_9EURO|nr:uncharacterized protein ATNIH1004_006597 [Aspergillus tanneri]KAA8647895.1 hypothetical protein ATNIH1004_006597 [Aspergillus tanneri]
MSIHGDSPQGQYMRERYEHFRGHAKVGLEHLEFETPLYGSRVYDQKNVNRLVRVFELEQCLRLEPAHHIVAIIDNETLQQAVTLSDVTEEQLRDASNLPWLFLPEGYRLSCLYGKHRIAAAKKFLLPGDRWWSVTLYGDLPEHVKQRLISEAPNAKEYEFGDIFRNLRHYQLAHNDGAIGVWKSRLSKRRSEDLERLSRRYISFTALRRLDRVKCPNEIIHYLDRIYRIWSSLFPEGLSHHVDSTSVRYVQNLMPQQSSADGKFITHLIAKGRLFPSLKEPEQRDGLLRKLVAIPGRILSLYSLAQDTLLLESCANSLQCLVPGGFKDLRYALLSRFSGGGNTWPVQSSYVSGAASIFSLRATMVVCNTIYREPGRHKAARAPDEKIDLQIPQPAKIEARRRLAFLACGLGFDSDEIQSIRLQNTMKIITREFLVANRPRELYNYPQGWEENGTRRVVDILNLPRVRSDYETIIPPFTVDRYSEASKNGQRCGLPSRREHRENCEFLYVPQVYSPDQAVGTYPSTFAIMRDIFFSFFGARLFPSEFVSPWWSTSPSLSEPNLSSENDYTQVEEANNASPTSSIDLESHPPGTPTQLDKDQGQLSVENQSMPPDVDMGQALILRPPMAPGFEDENGVAPLNLRVCMSHHRGAKEILSMWSQSHNGNLAVFYFFKSREYCKFDVQDIELRSHLESFVFSIANDHHFVAIEDGALIAVSPGKGMQKKKAQGLKKCAIVRRSTVNSRILCEGHIKWLRSFAVKILNLMM